MPAIVALINKITALLKDAAGSILLIYAEKGIAPFKKPLLYALPSLLAIYGAVYFPLVSKVKTDRNTLEKLQTISVHYADYEAAKTKLAAYRRRLPLIKDKDELLSYVMASTAKAHEISYDSLSAQTENEIGNILLVSREVTVTTTYAKFGGWVADIENSPMLLRVAEVSLKKDGTRTGWIKATMKLSTLFLRADE
jgi:hypothetical protein